MLKKSFFLAFALILFIISAYCQDIKITYENNPNGYTLFASNNEIYPISILLQLSLTNLNFSEAENKIIIIPANTANFKIGELSILNAGKSYNFSYKFKSAKGDVTIKNYDANYQYDLPFKTGNKFNVYQGYNGNFSHKNENALDFTMPEGTEILAAREGIVVEVVQSNTRNCNTEDCKKYNNYITIIHTDGSFANYAHIKYNGAKVKVGDSVKKSQLIALSGNVGYSSGPHLHFICYLAGFDKWNSLKTVFKTNDGKNVEPLKEGFTYAKDY